MRRLTAVLFLVLSACARPCTGSNVSSTYAPGFYRNSGDQTVYSLSANGTYCAVPSMAMMNAYGGLNRVRVTDDALTTFTKGYIALNPLDCGWPDGYYKKSGGATIFEISGTVVCTVPTKAVPNLQSILVVEANTDLTRHKSFVGNCSTAHR